MGRRHIHTPQYNYLRTGQGLLADLNASPTFSSFYYFRQLLHFSAAVLFICKNRNNGSNFGEASSSED